MDKSWIGMARTTRIYNDRINEFVKYLYEKAMKTDQWNWLCPCRKCGNAGNYQSPQGTYEHLFSNGIQKEYTLWVYHGEENPVVAKFYHASFPANNYDANPAVNLVNDAFPYEGGSNTQNAKPSTSSVATLEYRDEFDRYNRLMERGRCPVYDGCEYDLLSTTMEALMGKAKHGKSNSCFDADLKFLKKILPQQNILPENTREAMKIVSDLGMECVKIHACIDNCMLYYKDMASSDQCQFCRQLRYIITSNNRKVPRKFIYYLPIGPRMQRLYMCSLTSKHMRWHAMRETISPTHLVHPSDGEAWKHFDREFP